MNRRKKLSTLAVIIVFLISAVSAVSSLGSDNVEINSAFSDPVFKAAIALHYDSDGDGYLSPEERSDEAMIVSALVDELASARGVDADTLRISSISGIENFENLKVLRCNNIGELGTLDVSALTQLETLDCSNDALTSLDLSDNVNLKRIHCCANDFTSLDFTANTALEWLHCYNNADLKSLNLSGLTNLEELSCYGCDFEELSLSTNSSLRVLNCSYNHLSSLDLSATAADSLTDYNLGNQSISLELIYDGGLIKAPIDLDESAVYSSSLDGEGAAYSNGAFCTDDYSKLENGFTYYYTTGGNNCAEMKVNVSVYHTHDYAASSADYENKKLTVKCQICGDEHILDGDYSEAVQNPTCTEKGSVTKTLSAVFEGETYSHQSVTETDALGHTEVTDDAKEATCTESGLTEGKHCSVCQAVLVEQTEIPAKGHTEVIDDAKEATCTESGLTEGKHCSVCQAVLVEQTEIPAKGHTEVTDKGVEATCTESGLTEGKHCSVCQAVLVEQTEIPAKGHTEVIDDAKAPTCTETGLTEGKHCSVCQAVIVEQTEIPAKGHTEVIDDAKAPTCTESGLTEGKHCSVCRAVLVEQTEIPAKGHVNGEAQRENEHPSTCAQKGYYDSVIYCTVCGEKVSSERIELDLMRHVTEAIPAVEPTCTETGLTEGTRCRVCQTVLTPQEVVGALGHDYKDVVTEPKCTEKGYTTHTCSRCNDSFVDTYTDALEHDYQAVVTEAKCGEKGYTTHTCSRCKDSYVDTYTDALEHDYQAVVTKPTCTEKGYTTHTCSRCKDSFVDTYTNALGHKWNDGVVTVQPTVQKEGTKLFTCTVCGATRTESIPKATPADVTPSNDEANKATVNRTIQKPVGITTVSNKKKKQLIVSFNPVSGAQNYRVMFRKQGAKYWTYSWTGGTTQYIINNLKNNGLYEFQFAAYKKNAAGNWERGDYSVTSYRYYYKATLSKVKTAKKAINVSWKRNKNASGYLIEYADNYNMNNSKRIKIKSASKTAYKIKGLKKGKKYYVRVRAYKIKGGKEYTGEFSKRKGVKAK